MSERKRAIHVDWEKREIDLSTGKFIFYLGDPHRD